METFPDPAACPERHYRHLMCACGNKIVFCMEDEFDKPEIDRFHCPFCPRIHTTSLGIWADKARFLRACERERELYALSNETCPECGQRMPLPGSTFFSPRLDSRS